MDLPATLGTILGTALVTFTAAWRGFVTPLKHRLDEPAKLPKDFLVRLATLESENREMRRRLDEQAKATDNLEHRVNHMVTSEEFAAHAATTVQSVQNLTEKVGQARGSIETWLTTFRAMKG